MRAHPTRLLIVALAVVLAALALSCGSDDTETAASSPTTTTEPTAVTSTAAAPTSTNLPPTTTATTEPMTDEEAILAAVDGYWQSFLDANNPPDPNHPDLARYRTGDALRVTVENVAHRQELNQYVRLPENSVFHRDPAVLGIEGDRATIEDCVIDDSELVQAGSEVILNSVVETTLTRMTLERGDDGIWRVSEGDNVDQWDGAVRCAG